MTLYRYSLWPNQFILCGGGGKKWGEEKEGGDLTSSGSERWRVSYRDGKPPRVSRYKCEAPKVILSTPSSLLSLFLTRCFNILDAVDCPQRNHTKLSEPPRGGGWLGGLGRYASTERSRRLRQMIKSRLRNAEDFLCCKASALVSAEEAEDVNLSLRARSSVLAPGEEEASIILKLGSTWFVFCFKIYAQTHRGRRAGSGLPCFLLAYVSCWLDGGGRDAPLTARTGRSGLEQDPPASNLLPLVTSGMMKNESFKLPGFGWISEEFEKGEKSKRIVSSNEDLSFPDNLGKARGVGI